MNQSVSQSSVCKTEQTPPVKRSDVINKKTDELSTARLSLADLSHLSFPESEHSRRLCLSSLTLLPCTVILDN